MRFSTLALMLIIFLAVTSAPAKAANVSARTLLNSLTVSAPSTMTGYDRAKFTHWIDADGDTCNTRNEVLLRQSLSKTDTTCPTISTGRWYSAYDGVYTTSPSGFDIDHFVALAESWRSGSAKWTPDTRKRFANDLAYGRSLIAVTASSNRSKGDKDPAAWMPTRTAYRCTYVVSWVAVKYRWKLRVDQTEKNAIIAQFNRCSASSLMLPQPPRAAVYYETTPPPTTGDDPRFDTCTEAKAAGYGPYYQGKDPEYYWYIDGDKDGIACE